MPKKMSPTCISYSFMHKTMRLTQASRKRLLFGLFFFCQLFIHHSSSLFCCLIKFWVFHSRYRLNVLGARRQSQPQNGRSRLPMARGSFGCSLDNILTSFTDDFFCFSFSSEPRLICHTVQGVLLRERHSGSNTNHLGSLSNGKSCINLSPFLLCCYF